MSIRLCVIKTVFLYQKVVVHFISMLISVLTFFVFFCFVLPRRKSSVSSLGCFCWFFLFKNFCWNVFFILSVHHLRVRGSPMWNLKAFEGQGLRAKPCCRKISDSIFWLHSFTPR